VDDQFTADGIVLDNAIAYWIHRVYQASRNEMYRAFRDHGEDITPEQWIVLVRLWAEDGRTQTELGQSTYRDRPTMSRILSGMERHGLLKRKQDPDHGRVWRIYLTAKGRALQAELVPVARKLVDRTYAGISKKDLETTRATLRRVFENVTGGPAV
jgi:DNA-binding MarR family transcriptional regulator